MLVLVASTACDDFSFEGWLSQPIPIATSGDVPVLMVGAEGDDPVPVLVDSASPYTVVHRTSRLAPLPGGPDAVLDVRHEILSGLSHEEGELRIQDGRRPEVTRFIFREVEIFDLPVQPVGLHDPIAVRGMLGVDPLNHFVVELSYLPQPRLTLLDEIPDSSSDLARDCRTDLLLQPEGFAEERCFAVIGTPLRGGGEVIFGGDVLTLPPTRQVIPVCIVPDDFDPTVDEPDRVETSGLPLAAVLATGLGTTVISRSAFERLKLAHPELEEQTGQTLHLPGGTEEVSLTVVPRVALIANHTSDLGPCGELARRRRLLVVPKIGLDSRDDDEDGASAAIVSTPIRVAVVDDQAALLQGLRKELRPRIPDIDMLVGGSLLKWFEVYLDFPGGRTLLRCADGVLSADACRVMPHCSASGDPRCPTEISTTPIPK